MLCFIFYIFSFFFTDEKNIPTDSGYDITGNLKDLKSGKCYLGYYFASNTNVIYVDTAKVDANGKIEFKATKSLAEGLYFVEFPSKKRLDLVISAAQTFEFQTQISQLNNISFNTSDENTQYYAYLNYVRPRQAMLRTRISSEQSLKIQQELSVFQNSFFKEKSNLLATRIIAASELPYIPTFTLPNGKRDSVKTFYYYKNHLFDNINLSDERLLRTNLIEPKLTEYLDNLTYQIADSAINSTDALMKRTQANAFRKYFASKMTAKYQKNAFIGAENVYVHLIDKYYIAEPNLWDASALKQTTARANAIRPLMLGQVIPNMTVTNTDGNEYALHDVSAQYTILYIYSLDCPHCQEHAPKMAAFQAKMAKKGVKVFAVAVERDEPKWRNFIAKYHTENLFNGIDKANKINFIKQYDTLEYPTDFVLDAQKKIIGKHINPVLLENYLKYLGVK
jgi:peroxiredoxin